MPHPPSSRRSFSPSCWTTASWIRYASVSDLRPAARAVIRAPAPPPRAAPQQAGRLLLRRDLSASRLSSDVELADMLPRRRCGNGQRRPSPPRDKRRLPEFRQRRRTLRQQAGPEISCGRNGSCAGDHFPRATSPLKRVKDQRTENWACCRSQTYFIAVPARPVEGAPAVRFLGIHRSSRDPQFLLDEAQASRFGRLREQV